MNKNKRFTVALKDEVVEKLDDLADKMGISIPLLIRIMISDALNKKSAE